MNRNLATQLPPWRQMVSGFAVAVFALVVLCSITQAHAQPSPAGKVVVNHLDHLVVASHNPALAVAETGLEEDKPLLDTPEYLARLLDAVLWSQSRSAVPAADHRTEQAASLADFTTPPLRAPPIA
ncbi:hypothetical protein [Marinobacter halophilus]|uniref:Uncharacterized protein n=1 Tax=Marinobacter halophilus TaxID=1323740 RepID=A0A2T1K977_9GAMM|nr:hypothetical protein [Marinobacter halophilus]PSF06686.1 hypothetical protein C7H08_16515 [Marinobacter halophilus]GGC74690.1 hypothetical protein GCM10011362_24090 [Marinobacter halophilus]